MPSVLLTGFEPFANSPANPSWDAVQQVARQWDHSATLKTHPLPVAFDQAASILLQLVDTHRPDVVIATGVAEGRQTISIERLAANLDDAPLPDNAGSTPRDVPIAPEGPDGLFTTLPVAAILSALHDAGIPAAASMTAGTYVCNHVFYTVQWALRDTGVLAGFIHVPASPEMLLPPTVPTVDVATTARALTIAAVTSLAALPPT
jgi:pyroglutamyl-peptidase